MQTPPADTVKTTLFAVALYWFVSISLIFANKILMSSDTYAIPTPLFTTWLQCVEASAILWGLGLAKKSYPRTSWLKQFPSTQLETAKLKAVAPLSLVFVFMIASNNVTLMSIPVAMYNVAKALAVVFNVVLGYLILGSVVSCTVLSTLGVVILGFLVGTTGDVSISFVGIVAGVVSSAVTPMNGILTKKILPVVNQDKWTLSLYNNINASLMFIPLMLLTGEIDILREHTHVLALPQYWFIMLISGFLGFAIGIVIVMVIKSTSPLTYCLVGMLKNSIQTVLGVYVYGTPMSPSAVMGVVLVMIGSLLYSYVRTRETAREIHRVDIVDSDPDVELESLLTAGSRSRALSNDDVLESLSY